VTDGRELSPLSDLGGAVLIVAPRTLT
jgi:hypothetical protein